MYYYHFSLLRRDSQTFRYMVLTGYQAYRGEFDQESPRTAIPNLSGTRDWFRGRPFLHGPGVGCGFRMIQAHYIQAHLLLCISVPYRLGLVPVLSPEGGDHCPGTPGLQDLNCFPPFRSALPGIQDPSLSLEFGRSHFPYLSSLNYLM